jgi:hypothetical protein
MIQLHTFEVVDPRWLNQAEYLQYDTTDFSVVSASFYLLSRDAIKETNDTRAMLYKWGCRFLKISFIPFFVCLFLGGLLL